MNTKVCSPTVHPKSQNISALCNAYCKLSSIHLPLLLSLRVSILANTAQIQDSNTYSSEDIPHETTDKHSPQRRIPKSNDFHSLSLRYGVKTGLQEFAQIARGDDGRVQSESKASGLELTRAVICVANFVQMSKAILVAIS
jgi:hypothetical protein